MLALLLTLQFELLFFDFEALLLVFIMMLQLQIHDLFLVGLLLLFELLVVVLLELGGEFLAFLVLHVDLSQIHFEFAEQIVDRGLVFLLDLLYLLLVALLHL